MVPPPAKGASLQPPMNRPFTNTCANVFVEIVSSRMNTGDEMRLIDGTQLLIRKFGHGGTMSGGDLGLVRMRRGICTNCHVIYVENIA